mmetsp:Transcript_11636/g.17644  ORF Transcript_11636/g.17644 Transcript_11636/m.17644 type:complete len:328 (-) Transcript_11636:3020-4003(-)
METTIEARDELSEVLDSFEANEPMSMTNDGSFCSPEVGRHEEQNRFDSDVGMNTITNSTSFMRARDELVEGSKSENSDWGEGQRKNIGHNTSNGGSFMKPATPSTFTSSLSSASSRTSSLGQVIIESRSNHITIDKNKKKSRQQKNYLPTSTSVKPETRPSPQSVIYSGSENSSGVHNRLYARSQAKQAEGKEKREQIAMSLSRKPTKPRKKISAKEASSLFDRLYVDGVQKQISLGRKKNVPGEESTPPEYQSTIPSPIISTTQANVLYNRLYSDAITKQIKEIAPSEDEKPKVKAISPKQANSLYERLYCETTLTLHRARFSEKA